ncbi:MAG: SGNH/GDSL hydrolase family protein [Nocardioides sp.]
MGFTRYVALGDSFTEGVGDADPTRPNGVRGWADRVAEVLAATAPGGDFGYSNLAIRGRKLDGVLTGQLEPALAMNPDLVTVYAGANDILRPKVDIDGLVERYDAAIGRLCDTGADVVVFTAFDPGGSATFRPTRGRFAVYTELVRWAAERRGLRVVDFWRMREYRDWRYWDPDRMHMSSAGHQLMAMKVLDVLGISHELPKPALNGDPDRPATTNRDWTVRHLGPWLLRRVRGESSGDELAARYPDLGPVSVGRRDW